MNPQFPPDPSSINPGLPLCCAVIHPLQRRLVVVLNGQLGFYEADFNGYLAKLKGLTVEQFNAKLGVSAQQAEVMLHCSVFGGWLDVATIPANPSASQAVTLLVPAPPRPHQNN